MHHVQTVTSEFLLADDLPAGTHLHLIVLNYVLPQQTAQLWHRGERHTTWAQQQGAASLPQTEPAGRQLASGVEGVWGGPHARSRPSGLCHAGRLSLSPVHLTSDIAATAPPCLLSVPASVPVATTRICADGGANRLYDQVSQMLPGVDPHTARSSFLPDLIKVRHTAAADSGSRQRHGRTHAPLHAHNHQQVRGGCAGAAPPPLTSFVATPAAAVAAACAHTHTPG